MMQQDIPIGTRLEIWPLTELSEHEPQPAATLVSQVIEGGQDQKMSIAIPSRGANLVTWPLGQRFRMAFTEPNQCCWTLDGEIEEQIVIDKVRCYRIAIQGEPVRQQRRDWFRLPVSLAMSFRFHEAKDTDRDAAQQPEEDIPAFSGMTRDISGGGASFVTDLKRLDCKLLDIEIPLRSDRVIRAKGHIVRKEVLNEQPRRSHIAIQFTEISRGDQDDLVRFVFREQVRARKVGG